MERILHSSVEMPGVDGYYVNLYHSPALESDGSGSRFALVLTKSWRSLPESVKRVCYEHWKSSSRANNLGHPCLNLVDFANRISDPWISISDDGCTIELIHSVLGSFANEDALIEMIRGEIADLAYRIRHKPQLGIDRFL